MMNRLALWLSWLALAGLIGFAAVAQIRPNQILGSIANLVSPTFQTGQTVAWQGDTAGKLRVNTGGSTAQFLLMVDGVNKVLQTNGVARICLAGTC